MYIASGVSMRRVITAVRRTIRVMRLIFQRFFRAAILFVVADASGLP